MGGLLGVTVAAVLFVGTHFALSHPLRRALVARLGERAFLGVYSLVAAVTLGGLARAYGRAAVTAPLWDVGDGLWAVATVLMLLAAVLLMGSLIRNPALAGASGAVPAEARGVFAVTRHPMMWAFAIWGFCHVMVYPVGKNIVLAVAITVLALVGSAMQDRKKAALDPVGWPQWEARTSFWPFAAVAAGRARLSWPGGHALGGGLVVWLLATWAHIPLAGWPAGIWRWVGW